MSYEYGRIPFGRGLNVIAGPNGAGKSSILLAISVALGQAYTERSRKLSDLIRRGKDIARVSLLFENRPVEGRRPVPFSRSDTFMLSRYLKSDGSYWYEADYREISKSEVLRLFRQFGLNPDNMLIIMHQGMVEEFSVTSPSEKLKMVEEAIGFRRYRESIVDAQQKLNGLVTEESSLVQLLESAGQTMEYWKGTYEKYLQRKSLLDKKGELERELVWSHVIRHENTIHSLREKLEGRSRVLADTVGQIERAEAAASEASRNLDTMNTEVRKLYFSLMRLEREKAEAQTRMKLSNDIRAVLLTALTALERALSLSAESSKGYFEEKISEVRYSLEDSGKRAEDARRKIPDLEKEMSGLHAELPQYERKIQGLNEKYVNSRVNEAILNFKKRNLEKEIADINRSVQESEQELAQLSPEVEKSKPRIETQRSPSEVAEEIRMVSVYLQTLGEIPEDAERIYTTYSSSYEDLRTKLVTVSENKTKALDELQERRKVWMKVIYELVEKTSPIYQEILSKIDAFGAIRLINTEDIESAGLELLVGFHGSPPAVLDAYTQSGGERSVAVMAFLLSLQQMVVSPFRAVDEFDIHLDPKNREAVFQMIFSYVSGKTVNQYIVITPSQMIALDSSAHVIVVQNAYGRSEVKLVA